MGVKKKKVKHLKLSTEKKKAWKVFSEFIRRRAVSQWGTQEIPCYTCGNFYHWKEIQAGHGIPGRNAAVLFLEEVVKPQCAPCNIWKRGNYALFTRHLIDELGLKEYDVVLNLSQQTVKFTALDYKDIADKYREKLAELSPKGDS